MERVIVTVKRADREWMHDLELPADVPLAQMVPMLLQVLRWPFNPGAPLGGYGVEARPPGRTLTAGETLAQAGIWDGAWLVLHADPLLVDEARFGADAAGAKTGWRRLDAPVGERPLPTPAPEGETPAVPSGGFAWKRLDEE